MTTVREMAEAEVKAGRLTTFDYALPQDWVDDVHFRCGEWPQELGVVWAYGPRSTWGAPYPLTPAAAYLLARYADAVAKEA